MDEKDYEVVAKVIMQAIQLDNGYGHFEGISYPKAWLKKITKAVLVFFDANPDKFTDEDIENISVGCYDENEERYGNLTGWKSLDRVLNDYYDNGMGVGKVEEMPRLKHTYKKYKKQRMATI